VVFQKGAEIKQRSMQDATMNQQISNEQPSDPAIAIKEWMDRLELGVGKSAMNERRELLFLMKKSLEVIECLVHFGNRWRHERGATNGDVSRADPILRRAKVSRRFLCATDAPKQFGVDFPNQAEREWERGQPVEPIVHGADVVDDFANIVRQVTEIRVELEGENILERALRSFNLRAIDCLPANIHRNEEVGVRQRLSDAIEAADCLIGT
jgi:hypothetical protein